MSEPIPDSLPRVLVVTNRPFLPDDEDNRYLPNKIADYRKVTYIEAGCKGNNWYIRPLDGFNEGMKTIDNGKDILLFIHGHGKTFPSSIARALRVKNRYDVSLILFDWPASNSNFNKSLSRVRRCSENCFNLLLQLKEYRKSYMSESQHLSIMAHSLGNYFLTYFVVSGNWQFLDERFVDNIIFNAPAVRAREHGEVISLLNISKNKYVILNKNDKVLRGAHLLTSGKMLGNVVVKPHAQNTRYIHFTDIARTKHTYFGGYHQFEHDNKAVYDFYYRIIHGGDPDLSLPDFKPIIENEYMIQ